MVNIYNEIGNDYLSVDILKSTQRNLKMINLCDYSVLKIICEEKDYE